MDLVLLALRRLALLFWVLWSAVPQHSFAQSASDSPLRVITRVVQPFVIKDAQSYTGFSIELWAAVAK